MKILIAHRLYHPVLGGTVVIMDSLARAFRNMGHEVRICTKEPAAGPEERSDVLRTRKFSVILGEMRRNDAVVLVEPGIVYALAAFLARKPRIGSLQTWMVKPGGLYLRQRFRKLVTHLFSRFVAPCKLLSEGWGGGYEIIPNGYDADAFFNRDLHRDYDFIFLGRFNRDKAPDVFIAALAELHRRGQDFRALLIGDGETLPLCQQMVSSVPGFGDKVRFTGKITDRNEISGFLNRTKVMVVPNRWDEPFGMIVLEGLACGCRLVVTRSGALAEVSGGFSRTVPKDDPAVMAEAMLEEVREAPYESGAVQVHLAQFRWDRIAALYLTHLSPPSEGLESTKSAVRL